MIALLLIGAVLTLAACGGTQWSRSGAGGLSSRYASTPPPHESARPTTTPDRRSATKVVLSTPAQFAAGGEALTIKATVSPNPGGGHVAFAIAELYEGPAEFLSPSYPAGCQDIEVKAGTATCAIRFPSGGTGVWKVTATYSGDSAYQPASSGQGLLIPVYSGHLMLTTTPPGGDVARGQQVTLTASNIPFLRPAQGGDLMLGPMVFEDNGTAVPGCEQVPVNAAMRMAICTTRVATSGIHHLTVAVVGGPATITGAFDLTLPPSLASNWAGYSLDGGPVTSVTGRWVAPRLTCATPYPTWAAIWVGIDDGPTVEQAGEMAWCSGPGAASVSYYLWYDLYPDTQVTIPMDVHPGDTLQVSVSTTDCRAFDFTVANLSSGTSYSASGRTFSSTALAATPPACSSAEWIAEAPGEPGHPLPLADFASVTFTGIDATIGGVPYTLAGVLPSEYDIYASDGSLVAAPGAVASDGRSFTVTYQGSTAEAPKPPAPSSTPGVSPPLAWRDANPQPAGPSFVKGGR